MSSKEKILKNIRKNNCVENTPLPSYINFGIKYDDPLKAFFEAIKNAGGEALCVKKESLFETIKGLYKEEKIIASNVKELEELTTNPNAEDDPHKLSNIDLAIVKGEFAVAENGAVWVANKENRHRALYFIAQNIVIVVEKDNIVNNMHEAYEKVEFNDLNYGVFICGPSKTADIEQALVIGAHGPKSGYVIFIE